MVLPTGFEPVTLGFRDRSSAAELKAARWIISAKNSVLASNCITLQMNARRSQELRG